MISEKVANYGEGYFFCCTEREDLGFVIVNFIHRTKIRARMFSYENFHQFPANGSIHTHTRRHTCTRRAINYAEKSRTSYVGRFLLGGNHSLMSSELRARGCDNGRNPFSLALSHPR